MERYRYIIIDDEYPSHLMIHYHLKTHENYTRVANFSNPEEALIFLQDHDVDLIFLDIEMPEMNGFQFLEALQKNIFVVILTAYEKEHSLEAHQYYGKDLVFFSNKAQFSYYLPKIMSRFEKMYEEKEMLDRISQLSKNEIKTFPQLIHNEPIPLMDILYIIVIGHSIVLQLKDREEMVYRMTLRELLDILPSDIFVQIRRNTIINLRHVTSFTKTTVCVGNQHFVVSLRNRKQIVQALNTQKNLLYKLTD